MDLKTKPLADAKCGGMRSWSNVYIFMQFFAGFCNTSVIDVPPSAKSRIRHCKLDSMDSKVTRGGWVVGL